MGVRPSNLLDFGWRVVVAGAARISSWVVDSGRSAGARPRRVGAGENWTTKDGHEAKFPARGNLHRCLTV